MHQYIHNAQTKGTQHSSVVKTLNNKNAFQYCPTIYRISSCPMHAPQQPYMPPKCRMPPCNHACPLATMHAPPATMHASTQQPCMPPGNHACPLQPHMPPCSHACPPATTHTPLQPWTPPLWTEWQTGAKILPCPKLRLRAVIMEDGCTSWS